MIEIKIHGLNKTYTFMRNLPRKIKKTVDKTGGEWLIQVQKTAKLMAPNFSGQLAESIVVKYAKDEWTLEVESPYGWFQEVGFDSPWLPAGLPVEGGYRLGDWMSAKGLAGFGFKPSGKPHPFIGPAYDACSGLLTPMLQNAIEKACKESQ